MLQQYVHARGQKARLYACNTEIEPTWRYDMDADKK